MAEKVKGHSKKTVLIIVAIVLCLVAIGGFTAIFLLNYNAFQPNKPVELKDGVNVYLTTEMNDSYRGYRFNFVGKDEDLELTIDSKSNFISSTDIIEALKEKYDQERDYVGTKFEVRTCYLGEKAGNNSEYSKPLEWILSVYLNSTVCYYDDNQYDDNETIEWSPVEHADYYRVFINGDEEGIISNTTYLNVKGFELGEKTITVLPYSNNQGYLTKPSSLSQHISFIHYLPIFADLSFDKEGKVLTAYANEQIDAVEIILTENHIVSQFEVQQVEERYMYTIDLSTIYNDEEMVGIKAAVEDEYHLLKEDSESFVNVNQD